MIIVWIIVDDSAGAPPTGIPDDNGWGGGWEPVPT